MIKVNYNIHTGLVQGYYPDSINYVSIPEPYLEISEEQHLEILGKKMCVVDGVLQEYKQSSQEIFDETQKSLIAVRKSYLKSSADYYAPDFPEDVLAKRALAREEIDAINAATTLKALEKFNIIFE